MPHLLLVPLITMPFLVGIIVTWCIICVFMFSNGTNEDFAIPDGYNDCIKNTIDADPYYTTMTGYSVNYNFDLQVSKIYTLKERSSIKVQSFECAMFQFEKRGDIG